MKTVLLFLWVQACRALTAVQRAANETYDYIVIGGGAVGCPMARTVAAAGKKVLIIERGPARSKNDVTLDIFGAGLGMTDPKVSQLVVTKSGVRSHIGNGLGGGTGINFAIVIQEEWDYWSYIESLTGFRFDWDKLYAASNWTHDLIAKDVPRTLGYGTEIRKAFEQVLGPNRGSQVQIQINSTWNGKTLFDPGSNWFRVAADYLLGVPNATYPEDLSVLLEHTVHKIDFVNGTKATCVQVAPTTLADYDTILPGAPKISLTSLLPLTSITRSTFNVKSRPANTTAICVREGGSIVVAAGALLTPLLLWKSGVGPKEKVARAGGTLIRDMPEIGENLRDRLFLPIGMFMDGELNDRAFPPRITQQLGITHLGTDCKNKGVWDPSLSCSTVPAEELSGARIAEGAIYATRFIATPQLRQDPAANLVFQVLQACAEETHPLGQPLLSVLCTIANPAIACFRRVAAPLSFISEPVATAEIDVDDDGYFVVDGHYLEDPVDIVAAVRAVSSTLAVINSGNFSTVMQPAGSDSCPMTILNVVVNIATQLMTDTQEVTPLDLSALGLDSLSTAQTTLINEGEKLMLWVQRLRGELSTALKVEEETELRDIEGLASPQEQREALRQILGNSNHLVDILSNWQEQKYATYPPTLPKPWDIPRVEQFARSWSTSMWHWTGSLSMGTVVDSQFTVHGFENLKVADASVLNRMSRMNPLFTLCTLGRYIGLVLAGDTSQ